MQAVHGVQGTSETAVAYRKNKSQKSEQIKADGGGIWRWLMCHAVMVHIVKDSKARTTVN
jgi:hypothetical protein